MQDNLHCQKLFCRKIEKKILELYASKSVNVPTLNGKNISWFVNTFRQTGTVNNLPHHRMHSALTLKTLVMVLSMLSETPNKSLWRVAKEQKVSYCTAHCAACALQLHPYRIWVTHKPSPLDLDQYLHYCNWLSTNFMPVPMQPTLLNDIFFQWSVVFTIWVHNSQNNSYGAADNSHVYLETLLYPWKNRRLVRFIGHQNHWASFFCYHDHRRGYYRKRNATVGFNRTTHVPMPQEYYGCLEIFSHWPSYFIWSVASSISRPRSTQPLLTGIPQRSSVFTTTGDSWGLESEYNAWNWQNSVFDAATRHQ